MILSERLNNQAIGHYKVGRRQQALALLEQASYLDPLNDAIQSNLALVLTHVGKYSRSRNILARLIEKDPKNKAALNSLGILGMVSGHPEMAVTAFTGLMSVSGQDMTPRFDRACALIQSGDWENGWKEYECRLLWKPEQKFDLPMWDGSPGKHVFVWAEQGIGDVLQFARYLPWVAEMSAKVYLAVPASLMELFSCFSDICTVVPLTGAEIPVECQVAMMSLAAIHGTTRENILPPPKQFGQWDEAFKVFLSKAKAKTFKVGLCWSTNASGTHSRERSIPFEDLIPLLGTPGAEFHSFQVGDAASDISRLNCQSLVVDHFPEIDGDWVKTKEKLLEMDMVVSVDTAVAHLAASMEIPTIMLMSRRDIWRWAPTNNKTTWYPTMTVFQIEAPFVWDQVVQKASDAIKQAMMDRCQETNVA